MKRVYYLSTCSTCSRILKERVDFLLDFEEREIKSNAITPQELDEMRALKGSYEALFSRKSQQIKVLGLDIKNFTESDYRSYILSHYSFLRRPVFIIDDQIFVSSDKNEIEALDQVLKLI